MLYADFFVQGFQKLSTDCARTVVPLLGFCLGVNFAFLTTLCEEFICAACSILGFGRALGFLPSV